MQQVQQQMITNGCFASLVMEEGMLLTKLEERRKQEDILWKQKSRVQWLQEGERNTCFFHNAMIQHRHHNRIFLLLYQGRNRLVKHKEMENLFVNHFQNLLLESIPDRLEVIDRITRHIPQLAIRDQNLALMRVVTLEEVEEVVEGLAKENMSGPDGFIIEFFQVT